MPPAAMFSPRDLRRVRAAFFLFPRELVTALDRAIKLTALSIERDIQDNMARGSGNSGGWTAVDNAGMISSVTNISAGPLSRVVGVAGRRSEIVPMVESGTGIHFKKNPRGHLVGLTVPAAPSGGKWIKPKSAKMMRFVVRPNRPMRRTPPAHGKPAGYKVVVKHRKGGKEVPIPRNKTLNGVKIIYASHVQGMMPRYMLSSAAIENRPVFVRNVNHAARQALGRVLSKVF